MVRSGNLKWHDWLPSNSTYIEWPHFTYLHRYYTRISIDFIVMKTKFSLACHELLHCHSWCIRTEHTRLHELSQSKFHFFKVNINSYQCLLQIYVWRCVHITYFDSVPLRQGIQTAQCGALYQMVCAYNWKH